MAKAKQTKTGSKAADIRALTDDQINQRVVDIAKEHLNLRFQKAGGQGDTNTKAGSLLRKEVARLKTEQSARRNAKSA